MHRLALPVAALALLVAAVAAADVIVLRTGEMVEGKVLSLDESELALRTTVGRTTIDRETIDAIHLGTTIEALRRGAEPAEGEGNEDGVYGIGDIVIADGLELRLESVSIGRVDLVDLLGQRKQSKASALAMRFSVTNTQRLKALKPQTATPFLEGFFAVSDQDDREIDTFAIPLGSRVADAIRDGDEIEPGETVAHVEAFAAPHSRAKELTCVVDLRRFGGEGAATFRFTRREIGR